MCFGFLQTQTLRQGSECKQFIWEVILRRKERMGNIEGKASNKQCIIKVTMGSSLNSILLGNPGDGVLHACQNFPNIDELTTEAGVFVHQLLSVIG